MYVEYKFTKPIPTDVVAAVHRCDDEGTAEVGFYHGNTFAIKVEIPAEIYEEPEVMAFVRRIGRMMQSNSRGELLEYSVEVVEH